MPRRFSDPVLAREGGIRGRSRIRTRNILALVAKGPLYAEDKARITAAVADAVEIEEFLADDRAAAASREAGK